jgi:hypothetical protein
MCLHAHALHCYTNASTLKPMRPTTHLQQAAAMDL